VGESEVPNIVLAGVLAATPLLVYAAAHTISSRYWSVEVDYTTSIDGLLLQAYFTGAGSFLPMATDIECAGREDDCMRVAAVGIGSLYTLHLALIGLGAVTGSTTMEFASSMALLYAFVFIFPVRPLPGSRIWKHKRRVWVALVIPILASFYFLAPAGLTVIV
jgi:Zn-dependent protease